MKRALLTVFSGFFAILSCTAQANVGASELDVAKLKLASANALVVDTETGKPIYSKNPQLVTPIASITKLMTAMVVLDAALPLEENITIGMEDIDTLKGTHSRLRLGIELSRRSMLQLALMSSENRAASALGRHYPGGLPAFVQAMNAKARLLGMTNTHFVDSTGLSSENVSTAEDLVKMVNASSEYPVIREFTTMPSQIVEVGPTGYSLGYNNTNSLVRSDAWEIMVSKTGFIQEAGRCLVMMARIASRPVAIVLLDSLGKNSRIGDANRIKRWMETGLGSELSDELRQVAVKPQPRAKVGAKSMFAAKQGRAAMKTKHVKTRRHG